MMRIVPQVNALGVARGKHKQCGCQLAVLSLPQEERFKPANILLPVMSRATVYKRHGMSRVLCGVDAEGKQHDEPNFAADMRQLHEGVWTEIPDDERPVSILSTDCTKSLCDFTKSLFSPPPLTFPLGLRIGPLRLPHVPRRSCRLLDGHGAV